MKIKKSFLLTVLIFAGVLLALVIFKATSHNRFRNDASKWAENSIDHSNQVTLAEIEKLHGRIMLIYLNPRTDINFATAVHTTPEKIMDKENISRIRKHAGPKILVADDPEIAARLWMLLSQTGIRELYILEE
jgi:hypothetical protein